MSLRSFASVEARRFWYELPLREMSKVEREGLNGSLEFLLFLHCRFVGGLQESSERRDSAKWCQKGAFASMKGRKGFVTCPAGVPLGRWET